MTTHNLVTVSDTTPVRITPLGTHSGMDITIQNIETSGNIYVGGEGTSATSYGHRISPGAAISFELPGSNALYLVADNAGSKAAILSIGLEYQN